MKNKILPLFAALVLAACSPSGGADSAKKENALLSTALDKISNESQREMQSAQWQARLDRMKNAQSTAEKAAAVKEIYSSEKQFHADNAAALKQLDLKSSGASAVRDAFVAYFEYSAQINGLKIQAADQGIFGKEVEKRHPEAFRKLDELEARLKKP